MAAPSSPPAASATAPRRPHCSSCDRPQRVCICSALPESPLQTSWNILVLQTRAESRASVATARLLPLVLARAHVAVGRPGEVLRSLSGPRVLLFPGGNGVELGQVYDTLLREGENGECGAANLESPWLVVVDGTWSSASRLVHKFPELRQMQRCFIPQALVAQSPPLFLARRPPSNIRGARSTAEAVALALDVLEGGREKRCAAGDAVRAAVKAVSEAQTQFMNTGNGAGRDSGGVSRVRIGTGSGL